MLSQLALTKPRQRIALWALWSAWVLSAVLLFAAFAWTYFDGRSLQALEVLRSSLGLESGVSITSSGRIRSPGVALAITAALVAVLSMLTLVIGLFAGPHRFRTMRAWLVFMALACGWLGFIAGYPEVYWHGQQRRVKAILQPANELVLYLHANWPTEDGDMTGIGPYLAYPQGKPTTIQPLRWATFPATKLRYSAIEGTDDGAIRFELSGSEAGAWLEWRPDEREPASFVSGLESSYTIVRKQRLAPNWFLVRYRPQHQIHYAF